MYKNWVQYAALVDCGSSGSRIYVYYWKDSEYLPDIHRLKKDGNIVSEKTNIPLSSFEDNANGATEYLVDLISKTYQYINYRHHSRTKLYILATAGMRIIPADKSKAIIDSLNINLQAQVKYQVEKIEVISGHQEGFFMWLALNYQTEKFQRCEDPMNMIEMGGASMQIAFTVTTNHKEISDFSYICQKTKIQHSYKVYAGTLLGLGANEALKSYQKEAAKENDAEKNLKEPCQITDCRFEDNTKFLKGSGNVNLCLTRITHIFERIFENQVNRETFSIVKTYLETLRSAESKKFYGLGQFYHAFYEFLLYQGPLVKEMYWKLHEEFCLKECSVHETYLTKKYYFTDQKSFLLSQCFRLTFMTYVIEKLIPFNKEIPMLNIKTFKEEVIEWTYGAILFYHQKNK